MFSLFICKCYIMTIQFYCVFLSINISYWFVSDRDLNLQSLPFSFSFWLQANFITPRIPSCVSIETQKYYISVLCIIDTQQKPIFTVYMHMLHNKNTIPHSLLFQSTKMWFCCCFSKMEPHFHWYKNNETNIVRNVLLGTNGTNVIAWKCSKKLKIQQQGSIIGRRNERRVQ